MGIKSLEFFKSNNFANSIITEISVTNWDMDNEKYCSIGIEGDFVNNVLRHYDLVFTHRIKSQKTKKHDRSPEALLKNFDTRNGIVLADVSIDKRFKKYYVKMKLKDKERLYRLSFKCDIFLHRDYTIEDLIILMFLILRSIYVGTKAVTVFLTRNNKKKKKKQYCRMVILFMRKNTLMVRKVN